ncbi:hypothetical protein CROQUDRAFT_90821 [Cronartium quercuum f. sp. fusiforme G11]|uniref:Uncharacterized protein n=1 Tax=Cronartium quercuum f. sp. fusiforme G11 TaxID=708437 RepID=A0A9P6NR73_9BASI|nr:hypothetical protein CROQUDRAFT_90821 [Cronartium quercuum f. sp. fusiforme G11]
MSIENVLNLVGEDECSWELRSPQEIYEESLEEACEAANEEAEHSSQPQQDTEHVPTRIEALCLINRLPIYLNNDRSQLAEKASTILCQLSNCLCTQNHI